MSRLAKALAAAPQPGEGLQAEPRVESNHPDVTALARDLTSGLDNAQDQVKALYQHVSQEISNEPHPHGEGTGAVDCLHNGTGDAAAKSRLLVALCR
ncbi:MAG: transglutaminase family protein, partial [Planctomycetota bacterium]